MTFNWHNENLSNHWILDGTELTPRPPAEDVIIADLVVTDSFVGPSGGSALWTSSGNPNEIEPVLPDQNTRVKRQRIDGPNDLEKFAVENGAGTVQLGVNTTSNLIETNTSTDIGSGANRFGTIYGGRLSVGQAGNALSVSGTEDEFKMLVYGTGLTNGFYVDTRVASAKIATDLGYDIGTASDRFGTIYGGRLSVGQAGNALSVSGTEDEFKMLVYGTGLTNGFFVDTRVASAKIATDLGYDIGTSAKPFGATYTGAHEIGHDGTRALWILGDPTVDKVEIAHGASGTVLGVDTLNDRLTTDQNTDIGDATNRFGAIYAASSRVDSCQIDGSTSGTLTLRTAPSTTSHSLFFPGADGSTGQVLSTNGSGTLSWVANGGPSLGDWVDEGAITIGGTTSAPTKPSVTVVDKVYERDLGNNWYELLYRFACDVGNGGAVGSGEYLFTLPNSRTFDSSQPVYTGAAEFALTGGNAAAASLLGDTSGIINFVDEFYSPDLVITCTPGIIPYNTTQFRVQALTWSSTGSSQGGGRWLEASSLIRMPDLNDENCTWIFQFRFKAG